MTQEAVSRIRALLREVEPDNAVAAKLEAIERRVHALEQALARLGVAANQPTARTGRKRLASR